MYRLDAHYPSELYFDNPQLDGIIEALVGKESGSSGMGGNRDLQFYFDSEGERDKAAERISKLPSVSVVRRTDLDSATNITD